MRRPFKKEFFSQIAVPADLANRLNAAPSALSQFMTAGPSFVLPLLLFPPEKNDLKVFTI